MKTVSLFASVLSLLSISFSTFSISSLCLHEVTSLSLSGTRKTTLRSPSFPTGQRSASSTTLFLAFQPSQQQKNNDENSFNRSSNGDDGKKKKNWQRPKFMARIARLLTNKSPMRFAARFQQLSRKGKTLVITQLLFITMFCTGLFRQYQRTTSVASRTPTMEITYSSFLDLVEQQSRGKQATSFSDATIDRVRVGGDKIFYRVRGKSLPGGREFLNAYTRKVPASPELVSLFRNNGVPFSAAYDARASMLSMTLRSFMVTFYFLILWRFYRTVSGAGGNSAKDVPGKLARVSELPLANFDEIQGIDYAKNEVMELVDALRNPEKYAILGARAPTGLLLEGPPGTGKTMLARATAASAGVPLLYCSGSDFVEMFVGRGAARVRKLFERAERLAPCIIFFDELDALGKSRDMGGMGQAFGRSNDEAEQTLNQLLACMDGLDSSRRICVLAATNRRDVLDPALVRPGRFDRIVQLKLPDRKGRENILRVHSKKLPGFVEGEGIDPNRPNSLGQGRRVDLSAVAAMTEGFAGADLEFLVNEAAIRAVRRVSALLREGKSPDDITPHVQASDFEESLANFYSTRRKNGIGEIMKNVWK